MGVPFPTDGSRWTQNWSRCQGCGENSFHLLAHHQIDVLSMFVLSKWQCVALPTHWRASSVRALCCWFYTFLDHTTNISWKVCALRCVGSAKRLTKQTKIMHQCTNFLICDRLQRMLGNFAFYESSVHFAVSMQQQSAQSAPPSPDTPPHSRMHSPKRMDSKLLIHFTPPLEQGMEKSVFYRQIFFHKNTAHCVPLKGLSHEI